MANRGGKSGSSDRVPPLGFENHYSDYSREIRRWMLLGRRAMTNLNSVLKSWDINLPTKVRMVRAMVFLVVMYGCESWTVKKAEHQRIDAFKPWCWRRLLKVPRTARRSNQSIWREINPEYSPEWLMLKLKPQYFGHLMCTDDSVVMNLNLDELQKMVRDREACVLQPMGSQTVGHDCATEQQQLTYITV